MNREALFTQVKSEYARMASEASRRQSTQSTIYLTPESYYEKRLNQVLAGISAGHFDQFTSGAEVVSAVEQDPEKWL